MLTDQRGNHILIAYNLETRRYKVFWQMPGRVESSADGFVSPYDALAHAQRQIDMTTALTVHKAQRRESNGDILFAV
jgi:hypothetical protein